MRAVTVRILAQPVHRIKQCAIPMKPLVLRPDAIVRQVGIAGGSGMEKWPGEDRTGCRASGALTTCRPHVWWVWRRPDGAAPDI
ncbi:hypothetical protein Apa02nite_045320 [Actinoplanes palleronii]|uniref:Uncharacterized protein n=1 Tax=Actinoplanes palleronii TaxID=113570 RepID=A0ABQ4BCL7_9ACTN|nr:hypothetical protein Apa02nite_045320 [Actinoplanes palleronii]